MHVALLGGGVIGGGWAARFLLNGHDVSVYDPAPGAEAQLQAVLDAARHSLPALYDRPLPAEGRLRWAPSLAAAVGGADWVQESAPERLALKQALYAELAPQLPADAVLASSTSGYKPSELQRDCPCAAQLIVAHPFNPVYLVPLVEVLGTDDNSEDLKRRAVDTLRGVGMHPLLLRREIDGFIGNRLQEAVWRETLWIVAEGVATTEEIDQAILYGFGLRWAQMGQFDTYRLAGGSAGMAHFLAQFGPSLQQPLTHLMDVPPLDDALIERITSQSDAQSGHLSPAAMARARDANLVALIRALKQRKTGAGLAAVEHEQLLSGKSAS